MLANRVRFMGTGTLTVLVVITVVRERNLPSQTTVASFVVSIRVGLGVEDSLGQSQPAGLVGRRIGEVELSGKHGGHAPEALIIVSQGQGDVARLVVGVRSSLVLHGGHDEVVV